MRKIKLQVDELAVSSFATTEADTRLRGTVIGAGPPTRVDPSLCILCVEPDTEVVCSTACSYPCPSGDSECYCVEPTVTDCSYDPTGPC